jgi:hypothetical protein
MGTLGADQLFRLAQINGIVAFGERVVDFFQALARLRIPVLRPQKARQCACSAKLHGAGFLPSGYPDGLLKSLFDIYKP